jgi:integrase
MAELFRESDGTFTVRAWGEQRTERGRTATVRYRVRYWYDGGEKGQDSAATEGEAIAKATAIWRAHLDGMLDAPEPDPILLGELVDKFVVRDRLSPASRRSYERALKLLRAHVGEERPLKYIGRAAIQGWLDHMTCKPVSKKTYLRTASALFKWAKREKFIDVDPTEEVKLAAAPHTIRPWLQSHEWSAFLKACSDHHRVRAEFVLHTGLRAGELCAAEWTWLHQTSGRPALTIPKMKSKHPRAIPLDKRAQELLDDAKRIWGDKGRIFGPDGFKGDNLRDNTVTACKRGNVPVVDFHGLRRSCGARWIERGMPLLHVSRLLGHADVSTTARHYAGIADGTLAAEIERVERGL